MDKLKHKIQDMYDQSDPPIFFSRNITIWQMAAIPATNTLLVFPFSEAVMWSRYIPPPSLFYVLYARDWLNKMGLIVIDELVHDVCVCMFGGCLPFLEIRPILRQKVSRFSTPINSAAKPRETA